MPAAANAADSPFHAGSLVSRCDSLHSRIGATGSALTAAILSATRPSIGACSSSSRRLNSARASGCYVLAVISRDALGVRLQDRVHRLWITQPLRQRYGANDVHEQHGDGPQFRALRACAGPRLRHVLNPTSVWPWFACLRMPACWQQA